MKKVLIINEGYSHNLGDQAILKATVKFYKDMGYDTDFLYLSKPNLPLLPKYAYQNSSKSSTKPSALKKIIFVHYWRAQNKKVIAQKLNNNYDLISFGGGQLFNGSNTGFPSQFALSMKLFSEILIKKRSSSKIVMLAVGCGTHYNKVEKKYFSEILKLSDMVVVRDQFSKSQMKKIFDIDAEQSPDIAFYDHQQGNDQKEPKALVSIANYEEVVQRYTHKSKEDYYKDIIAQIHIFEQQGLKIKLFFTTISDFQALADFNAYCIDQFQTKYSIADTDSLEKLIQELQSAESVFSGRMHALILALNYGCRVTVYELSQKLTSFKEEYVDQAVPYKKFEEIKKLIKNL